ncbi:hypothetical protein CTA1_8396 [Colletotrichum tanaceti]|uniref:Uncharacterized protein n=1 Tax=Colletotrichum tanaceti TaxID=1306861 RepID=A0A4U6XFE2_9PEZI|nr:hypothetical protein CTA1_8396 [Colletotrichum tanaceti]
MIGNAKVVVPAPTGPLVNAESQIATDPQVSGKYRYSGAFSWPPRFFEVRQDNVPKSWENLPFTDTLGEDVQEPDEDHISRLVRTDEN